MESELVKAGAELVALRKEARRFVRNPVEALLPVAIGPLVGAVAKGMRSSSKKQDKPGTG